MMPFATIKKQRGQCHLTTLDVNLLLGQQTKQQCYQIDKDVQLFLADLDREGSASHLHPVLSFQPSALLRRGLIALSAIALVRVVPLSPQLCKQVTLKGSQPSNCNSGRTL